MTTLNQFKTRHKGDFPPGTYLYLSPEGKVALSERFRTEQPDMYPDGLVFIKKHRVRVNVEGEGLPATPNHTSVSFVSPEGHRTHKYILDTTVDNDADFFEGIKFPPKRHPDHPHSRSVERP